MPTLLIRIILPTFCHAINDCGLYYIDLFNFLYFIGMHDIGLFVCFFCCCVLALDQLVITIIANVAVNVYVLE